MTRVAIVTEAFDPSHELAAFAAGRDDVGAIVHFVGICRRDSNAGAVQALELEHYPGFTEKQVARLAELTARKYALAELLVIHRVGLIAPGEAIVLVAAASPHRAAAFSAVSELMDFLKTDAPIWKREISEAGARWIEPSEDDRARRAALDFSRSQED